MESIYDTILIGRINVRRKQKELLHLPIINQKSTISREKLHTFSEIFLWYCTFEFQMFKNVHLNRKSTRSSNFGEMTHPHNIGLKFNRGKVVEWGIDFYIFGGTDFKFEVIFSIWATRSAIVVKAMSSKVENSANDLESKKYREIRNQPPQKPRNWYTTRYPLGDFSVVKIQGGTCTSLSDSKFVYSF